MQKTYSFLVLLMAMLSSVTLYAQDETLGGTGACGGPTAGNWTVPCGVTSVAVDVYGGGAGAGGGGGGSSGGVCDTYGGGAGGGGSYTTITIDVTPGSTFSYSAGAGGCGGNNGGDLDDGDNGGNGGNSTFSGADAIGNPVSLTAGGGSAGAGGDGCSVFGGGGGNGNGGAAGTANGGATSTSGTAGSNGSGGTGGTGGSGGGAGGGNGGTSNGGTGATYGGGGGGGNNSNGGAGGTGVILITYVTSTGPSVTPTVNATAATCSSAGTATITNYVVGETYVFAPAGPTAGAGGAIAGMTAGTNYTVAAGAGVCASAPSAPFSIDAATGSVVDPIVATTAASCNADGSSTITTYNPANTYDFMPPGPTAGAGGAITGMTLGTSYTVTESDLTCTSAPSASFTNDAQFPAPVITITGTLSYCAGNNTTISANGGVSYIWDDLANSTTPDITVTQGTYNVGALDANGCQGTASAIVTEAPPFPITFTGALSHCIGGSTDITASGGTSYVWNDPANSTTATVTLTQGTYTVTAYDANQCVSTDDVTITESAAPVAAFAVVDACTGDAVQFIDATTIATGAVTNWDWDFGDGNTSTLQGPTHIYATPGTYDVTLVAGADNCTDQITLQANSFPNPVADFATTNVCVGTDATFTDNSTATGSTIAQWAWDFDGLGNAVQQSPTYVFPTAGTYNVTVGVITSDFCADTHTEQIVIYPAPVPAFTATAVCEGSVTTFQNQSTGSAGQAWDFGDVTGTSLLASPTYTYAAAGTYPVTLGITSSDGCIGSVIQDVTVNPLPTVDALSTDILCAGETNGTATATAAGGTAPYTYQWTDLFQSTTTLIENLVQGDYTITVTDALGCTADTTVTVIEPLPIRVEMVPREDTCGLSNGAVQAVMLGGTAPFVYEWSAINDSASIYSEDITPSGWNTNLDPGTYSVVVTDIGGCSTSGEATVEQIPSPVAAFTTRSKPEDFIDPTVQLINESTGAVSYEWHLGEGNLSYAEDPLFEYDSSGVYLVMLIAYNEAEYGCVDTTFGYVEVEPMFTFYVPNAFTPDGDGINDTWVPQGANFEYESYNVQIYDRWGGLVWQTDNPNVHWDGINQKTLLEVKQGMYVYQFVLKKFNTFKPKQITGTVTLYRHN
jgi:gliding motility-associated-like protein